MPSKTACPDPLVRASGQGTCLRLLVPGGRVLNPQSYHSAFHISSTRYEEALPEYSEVYGWDTYFIQRVTVAATYAIRETEQGWKPYLHINLIPLAHLRLESSEINFWIHVNTAHKGFQSMMTGINALKIGWKQLPILVFFFLTLYAHGAPPGYTQVYTGNFYGPTNVNGSWSGGCFSSLNSAGQGFTQALGYWEVVLNTNNWGYWPDIWLSGSIDKQRTNNSAELGVLEAGPMTGIHQHVKVLSPKGQEMLSLLQPTLRGVNQGVHVFGCLITAGLITFSLDNSVLWTEATPPEATQPLFAFCNFVVAKIPPDPGAITTAVINCYVPPTSVPSPSPTP